MKNFAPHKIFLLQRASQDENYLAYTLYGYLKAKEKDWPQLLEELGCSEETLLKLALCRNLKLTDPNFSTQLEQIALYTKVDHLVLSDIVKRSAFSSILQTYKKDGLITPLNNTYLAAAREKDAEENSPPEDKK